MLSLTAGSYRVTPEKEGWYFNPQNIDYTSLDKISDGQNYIGIVGTRPPLIPAMPTVTKSAYP
jgi:hypothetical protein